MTISPSAFRPGPTIGASAPTTYEPELYELLDESPEGMYALFEARGWGDGLPLVPPTPERVDAMRSDKKNREGRLRFALLAEIGRMGTDESGHWTVPLEASVVREALVATAIGLMAAIPAVMAYNYFSRRIRVIAAEMETFSSDFLNIVRRRFF